MKNDKSYKNRNKDIQARLVASSAWQQLVTAVKKTWFSVIVIVEITINGDVGDYSDDDGRDDNRDVKSMRKIDVIRYEAKSQQQVGKQLNN